MTRPLRIELEGGLYHVLSRGDRVSRAVRRVEREHRKKASSPGDLSV